MRKFFGIINFSDFVKLELSEQYRFLIDSNVYVIGKSNNGKSGEKYDNYNLMDGYPNYIGQDFELNGKSYKINSDFVDEVFNETMAVFNVEFVPKIEGDLKTLELKAKLFSDLEIKERTDSLRKEELNYLESRLYSELYDFDESDEKNIYCVLKKHLSVNSNDLFDFILGLGNFRNYQIYSEYYRFYRIKKCKKFHEQFQLDSNSKDTPNPNGLTMSQKLLSVEAILLKKDFFCESSNFQKAKVYSLLLGYNEDNIRKKLTEFEGKPTNKIRLDNVKIESILNDLKL